MPRSIPELKFYDSIVALANKFEVSQGSWANNSSLPRPSRMSGEVCKTCVDGARLPFQLLFTAPQYTMGSR